MTTQAVKCKNNNCNNQIKIEFNSNDSGPILFCSESCLDSFQNERLNSHLNYEDPKEVRILVQNLISQTKQLQSELDNLKKIRKTYFGLFKEVNLKDETYKRRWTFDNEVSD